MASALQIPATIPFNKLGESVMESNDFLDQEYENLNDAILQAIVTAKEVQDILARFKEQGHMNDKAVLNLFLSLDELHQMIEEKTANSGAYKVEPKASAAEKSVEREEKPPLLEKDVVDGAVLTLNEVLFEKYYQRKFDQSVWMKKARVRF
jgi:3-methyladenine DNA glycosylase AlkD